MRYVFLAIRTKGGQCYPYFRVLEEVEAVKDEVLFRFDFDVECSEDYERAIVRARTEAERRGIRLEGIDNLP